MDRRTYPLSDDSSHQGMAFKPASSSERDEYLRTFPDPMPSTHYLHWQWVDGEVRFEPRPKPEAVAAGAKAGVKPLAPGTNERRAELNNMTVADLQALAAETGATIDNKATKAQIIAQIIDHQSKAAAAAKP
jgi:hypothetical protein